MRIPLYTAVPAVLAALAGCAAPAGPPPGRTAMTAAVVVEPWKTPSGEGTSITSGHYRIYTTSRSRAVLDCLPGFMEAAHANYTRLTDLPAPPAGDPMPMYVMGTRNEWAALTQLRFGESAGLLLSIESGGYCHGGVCVLWDMGGLGVFSVASHEGMHQFLSRELKQAPPAWLEEGISVAAEGYDIDDKTVLFDPARNAMRFSDLRRALVQGEWLPPEKLLSFDAGDAAGGGTEKAVAYYGQLWSLILFIKSDDAFRGGLARLFADARSGRIHERLGLPAAAVDIRAMGRVYHKALGERIFRAYISDDMDAFEARFLKFARRLAGLE